MRPRKDFRAAVDLYENKKSIAQVAAAFNVSRQAMWEILKLRNVAFRPRVPPATRVPATTSAAMKPSTDWTPELTAHLRQLFAEGHSYAQIASSLAMTRNAILGKCNRLGLYRASPSLVRAKSAKEAHLTKKIRPRWDPKRNSLAQKIQSPKVAPNPFETAELDRAFDLAIPRRRRKTIFTLGPRDCKFVIGDPATPSYFFCGARRLHLLPYCSHHARRCYVPARGS